MDNLRIHTNRKRAVIDITDEVEKFTPREGSGIVQVFVAHTTAAITTADLDPGTDADLLDFLDSLVPERRWRHPHDPSHAPDHLLASLIGPEVSAPYQNGQLQLGTWQRIILVELDGPRERNITITSLKST
jgi:secondary thiamine-phosphate synthase enzyme